MDGQTAPRILSKSAEESRLKLSQNGFKNEQGTPVHIIYQHSQVVQGSQSINKYGFNVDSQTRSAS